MEDRERLALLVMREALDSAPAQREQFVSQRCASDPELRQRVSDLLRGMTAQDELASGVPGSACNPQHDTDEKLWPDPLIGSSLGPFRVIERIGRGGMGVVYRGVRESSDFAQDVAIKLIRRGFDFDDVQARFLRERRILARLSHPNLAHFIDGGVSTDGRPWFALEFVQGTTITQWCDQNRRDIRQRVRLFLDVCSAVQHAHTQLVVHRDLKPGNVLVDQTGMVRLLDFGVAGLLAGDADDGGKRSTIGQRHAMTPEYAAPEQFSGEGSGVTVDVYALGVTLYELIAGVLPYVIDRNDSVGAEMAARERPPQPLTQALLRVDAAPDNAASADTETITRRLAARKTSLSAYRTAVRGDLSRIIDKALAKEPARRYSTVQAFADDLARWLAGAPVQVTGNGWGYRLGKFVLRNRVAVALAAIAGVAVVAGVAGMAWKTQIANVNAMRADATQNFVLSLFRAASPLATADSLPSTEDLLGEGARRAQSTTIANADLQFDMLMTIGRIYLDLRRYSDALPLLKQALAVAERQYGAADTRLLPPLLGILQAESYRLEINSGEPQDALGHLQRAQAIVSAGKASTAERADVVLAECALRQANAREMSSVEECKAAIASLEQLPGADPGKLAKAYYLTARTLDLAGDQAEESIATSRRGLERVRAMKGDSQRYDELTLTAQLSETLASINRYDEALVEARRANQLASEIFQRPHPDVGKLLFDEASLLRKMGREEDAELKLREALAIFVAVYGEQVTLKSSDMFWTRLNLGTSLVGQRRYAEADAVIRGMIADVEADPEFRKQRRTVAQLQANLASSLVEQGRLDEAEPMVEGILQPFKADADGIPLGAVPSLAYRTKAVVLLERGNAAASLAYFDKAIRALGDGESVKLPVALLQLQLGAAPRRAGQLAAAVATGRTAVKTFNDVGGERHPGGIRAQFELYQSLLAAGDRGGAGELLALATQNARLLLKSNDPLRVEIEGSAVPTG